MGEPANKSNVNVSSGLFNEIDLLLGCCRETITIEAAENLIKDIQEAIEESKKFSKV